MNSPALSRSPAHRLDRQGTRSSTIAVAWPMLLMLGCTIPISYHDATTYENLTGLKAEIMTLVESFDSKPYSDNEQAIRHLALEFRKAYEYELGKGDRNRDTATQFRNIRKLFEDTVAEYKSVEPGDLGRKYFAQAAVVLGQAFDIAIATENEKNEDKR